MMCILFPADGSAPSSAQECPLPNVAKDSKVLYSANDLKGVVAGHDRSDWNLWIHAYYKEFFFLKPEDVPNPYFAGMVRGDIYVSVTVDDGYSGDLHVKIPPLSVGSFDDIASILGELGEWMEVSAEQNRVLKAAGAHYRQMSASEIKSLLEAAGLWRGFQPPRRSGRKVEARIFDKDSGVDQSGWVVEDTREDE